MAVSKGCRAFLGIFDPHKDDKESKEEDVEVKTTSAAVETVPQPSTTPPVETPPPPATRYDPCTSIKKDVDAKRASLTLINVSCLSKTNVRLTHPEDDSDNKLRIEVPLGEVTIFHESLPGDIIKEKTDIEIRVKERKMIVTLRKKDKEKWVDRWNKMR